MKYLSLENNQTTENILPFGGQRYWTNWAPILQPGIQKVRGHDMTLVPCSNFPCPWVSVGRRLDMDIGVFFVRVRVHLKFKRYSKYTAIFGTWFVSLLKAGEVAQTTQIDQNLFAEMCKPSNDVYYQSIKERIWEFADKLYNQIFVEEIWRLVISVSPRQTFCLKNGSI